MANISKYMNKSKDKREKGNNKHKLWNKNCDSKILSQFQSFEFQVSLEIQDSVKSWSKWVLCIVKFGQSHSHFRFKYVHSFQAYDQNIPVRNVESSITSTMPFARDSRIQVCKYSNTKHQFDNIITLNIL